MKLSSGKLWVHSPIQLSESTKHQVDKLGEVVYLVAPNHLHHLFLPEWLCAIPTLNSSGLMKSLKSAKTLALMEH
ncbi:hypothetical protein JCM19233_1276 [Vibrio astriarenae]|nr:hypothetical protein JCM19233_1276 [Vibrio sp. C7]